MERLGGHLHRHPQRRSASPYSAEADWQAPAGEGSFTITVSISDSGGMLCGGRQTVTKTLTIQVSTVLNQPPVIATLSATPSQVFPGGTADLACRATDPDGDPVSYSWSASRGTVTPLARETPPSPPASPARRWSPASRRMDEAAARRSRSLSPSPRREPRLSSARD